MKNKGEKGRYIQLNADFLGRARSDKKTFFNEECIKLEENNRSGKTRDHVRKIGNIKGTFLPKMSTLKHRSCRDLVDAEEVKKRWKEYTEDLYKTNLNELHYYDGVFSHLQSDILEYEVDWVLGSIAANKASGLMKFQ